MAETGRLTSSTIKRVIRPVWPKKKDITPENVFYIKVKVMKMLPALRANPEYDSFKEVVNDSVLLDGIDDELDLDDDMAHELAKQMWLDVLQSNMDSTDSIVTFVQYLQLIRENAKGSVFELALDNRGHVNGAIWKTATMRDNFERFGGIFLLTP